MLFAVASYVLFWLTQGVEIERGQMDRLREAMRGAGLAVWLRSGMDVIVRRIGERRSSRKGPASSSPMP